MVDSKYFSVTPYAYFAFVFLACVGIAAIPAAPMSETLRRECSKHDYGVLAVSTDIKCTLLAGQIRWIRSQK